MRDFLIAISVALLVFTGLALGAANVAQRQGGLVPLSATPLTIGDRAGREDLSIAVPSDGDPAFCCWGPDCVPDPTPNLTPGTFSVAAGGSYTICKYADQELRCIGSALSFDQAFVRTATATPTATATATP